MPNALGIHSLDSSNTVYRVYASSEVEEARVRSKAQFPVSSASTFSIVSIAVFTMVFLKRSHRNDEIQHIWGGTWDSTHLQAPR